MKQKSLLVLLLQAVLVGCKRETEYGWVKNAAATASYQLKMMVGRVDTVAFSLTVEQDSLRLVSAIDWINGFSPGSFWQAYEFAGDTVLKKEARKYMNMCGKVGC